MTVHGVAVVDTSVIAAIRLFEPSELPDTMLVTAITLGELSCGPHTTDDPAKRAGRIAVLQHLEATFDRSRTTRDRLVCTGRFARRLVPQGVSRVSGLLT